MSSSLKRAGFMRNFIICMPKAYCYLTNSNVPDAFICRQPKIFFLEVTFCGVAISPHRIGKYSNVVALPLHKNVAVLSSKGLR